MRNQNRLWEEEIKKLGSNVHKRKDSREMEANIGKLWEMLISFFYLLLLE